MQRIVPPRMLALCRFLYDVYGLLDLRWWYEIADAAERQRRAANYAQLRLWAVCLWGL